MGNEDEEWGTSELIVAKCQKQMERDIATVAAEQALGTITATTAHEIRKYIYSYQKILKEF